MVIGTQPDLEKFYVEFGPQNGDDIFYGSGSFKHIGNGESLSRFVDHVELMNNVFGYDFEKQHRAAYCVSRIRKGLYKASEVKQMCINLKISPEELLSEYKPEISRFNAKNGDEVDNETKTAVFEAICDLNDN